jgi:hypothetical protein
VLRISVAIFALLQTPALLTNADLQLSLTAVKARIVVGEFTKVRADWTALRQISVLPGSEELLVDDGSGFVEHAEASQSESTVVAVDLPLAVGQRRLTEHAVGLKPLTAPDELSGLDELHASVGLVFAQPGVYRVKLRYEEAESNIVEIEVVAPPAADEALLTALRSHPALLTPAGSADETLQAEGDALVQSYGGHVYLVPFIQRRFSSPARSSFDARQAFDLGQSVFAADELLWRAETGAAFFDDAWARAAFEQVVQQYPASAAAASAAKALEAFAGTPPTLAVTASPAGLWPPNGKLVPITVLVDFGASAAAAPVVTLTSITCDDGCSPSTDIVGAAYGTDDRTFQVRAKRTGGGAGRTYTITYTATDSSQQQATATATVRVAHDQGH